MSIRVLFARYDPTEFCDGTQIANLWRFLRPVFSPSHVHVQHILDLYSKFAVRPHHVWSMVDIQSAKAENRRGKKIERKKKPQDDNIACPIPWGSHIKCSSETF